MKCRECSQEIEFHQTYFEVNGQSHIRFHHVCFLYLKPRRLMSLTGSMMPATIMRNDKDDNNFTPKEIE